MKYGGDRQLKKQLEKQRKQSAQVGNVFFTGRGDPIDQSSSTDADVLPPEGTRLDAMEISDEAVLATEEEVGAGVGAPVPVAASHPPAAASPVPGVGAGVGAGAAGDRDVDEEIARARRLLAERMEEHKREQEAMQGEVMRLRRTKVAAKQREGSSGPSPDGGLFADGGLTDSESNSNRSSSSSSNRIDLLPSSSSPSSITLNDVALVELDLERCLNWDGRRGLELNQLTVYDRDYYHDVFQVASEFELGDEVDNSVIDIDNPDNPLAQKLFRSLEWELNWVSGNLEPLGPSVAGAAKYRLRYRIVRLALHVSDLVNFIPQLANWFYTTTDLYKTLEEYTDSQGNFKKKQEWNARQVELDRANPAAHISAPKPILSTPFVPAVAVAANSNPTGAGSFAAASYQPLHRKNGCTAENSIFLMEDFPWTTAFGHHDSDEKKRQVKEQEDKTIRALELRVKNTSPPLLALLFESICATNRAYTVTPRFAKRLRLFCDKHKILIVADHSLTTARTVYFHPSYMYHNFEPDFIITGSATVVPMLIAVKRQFTPTSNSSVSSNRTDSKTRSSSRSSFTSGYGLDPDGEWLSAIHTAFDNVLELRKDDTTALLPTTLTQAIGQLRFIRTSGLMSAAIGVGDHVRMLLRRLEVKYGLVSDELVAESEVIGRICYISPKLCEYLTIRFSPGNMAYIPINLIRKEHIELVLRAAPMLEDSYMRYKQMGIVFSHCAWCGGEGGERDELVTCASCGVMKYHRSCGNEREKCAEELELKQPLELRSEVRASLKGRIRCMACRSRQHYADTFEDRVARLPRMSTSEYESLLMQEKEAAKALASACD